jgi:hypothetical protein
MRRNADRGIAWAIALWMAGTSISFAQVVITEVHSHPVVPAAPKGADSERLEFLELFNAGDREVDLSGYSIVRSERFVIPGGTFLAPGDYLLVARDPAFLQEHGPAIPAGVRVLEWSNGDFSDGVLRLLDASTPVGRVADEVALSAAAARFASEVAGGSSLELVHPDTDNSHPGAWRASVHANGTPGSANSRMTDAPVLIDENPSRGDPAEGLTRVSVRFSTGVTGVVAGDLTANGVPARRVTGTGAGPYVFEMDAPSSGKVRMDLGTSRGSGVRSTGGIAFAGETWQYRNPAPVTLSMPTDASSGPGATVQVPVSVSSGAGIYSVDLTIQFNPAILEAQSVTTSGIGAAAGFAVISNLGTPGTALISTYATNNSMSGSGEFLRIQFHAVGSPGDKTSLTFASWSANEGDIPATAGPGLFSVTCVGAANGTHCNDGNACTQTDVCQSGSCMGSNPVVCTALDACHVQGTCDTATGACSNPARPDGTACDDGNVCTAQDACQSGVCTGMVAIGAPAEVTGVQIGPGASSIAWEAVSGGVAGTVYDAVRGLVGTLPVGGSASETCMATGIGSTYFSDASTPAAGASYWYLVRARDACGTGTYGNVVVRGVASGERASGACP